MNEKFRALVYATVFAVVVGVGLFMYLPVQLFNWLALLFPAIAGSHLLRSVFEGLVRIVLFGG